MRILLGQVLPSCPAPQNPQNAIQHATALDPRTATLAVLARFGKQGSDFLPLHFRQQRTRPGHRPSFGAADFAYLSSEKTQLPSFQEPVLGYATASSEFPGFVLNTAAFVLAVLLTTWVVDTAAAQSIFGRITGTVTDAQGGAVAGVKITIVNEETKLERQATTDSNGYYVASDLPVGVYSVIAEQSGFKTLKKTGNDLVAGARMSVDLSLAVGEVSQRVEVAATAETINTTSGELARVIDSSQVRTVALNARNYMQLLSLTPGTALTVDDQLSLTTSLAINNQSVNGNRPDSNALSVDGGFNMDSGSNSSQVNNVGIDFIREVAIKSSNFSAEYGRNSGASVNVVTRSGGDGYHGAVFEFIRNDKLDAKNPAPGALKTPLRFNDFGWDFGGPIKRGKLFFFAGEEWKRIRLTATPQS